MCPVLTELSKPAYVLLELEQETHARVRIAADLAGKSMTYFLIDLIEREVYKSNVPTPDEESRTHIRGQRTAGTIPWSRGLSRAYRSSR